MALWHIPAGSDEQLEQRIIDERCIYLPWDGFDEDLSQLEDIAAIRELIRRREPGLPSGKIASDASQVWAFVDRIRSGDWIVVPSRRRQVIHIGCIDGPYRFDPTAAGAGRHSRPVRWIVTNVARDRFDADLLQSFDAFGTLRRIRHNDAEQRTRALVVSWLDDAESSDADGRPQTPTVAEPDMEGAAAESDEHKSRSDLPVMRYAIAAVVIGMICAWIINRTLDRADEAGPTPDAQVADRSPPPDALPTSAAESPAALPAKSASAEKKAPAPALPDPIGDIADASPLKKEAEAAWAKAQSLDRGQGIGRRVDAARQLASAAANHFERRDYVQAAVAYQKLIDVAASLIELDAQRAAAAATRTQSESERIAAESADAATHAATHWSRAGELDAQAAGQFDDGRFTEAAQSWTTASEVFAEAKTRARRMLRIAAARAQYEAAAGSFDRDLLRQFGGQAWARVDEALRIGNAPDTPVADAVTAFERAAESVAAAIAAAREHYIDDRFVAARAAADANDSGKAIIILNDLLQYDPEHTEAIHLKFDLLSRDGPIENSLKMKFVYVRPGEFLMGSPTIEPMRDSLERLHRVRLTRGYLMSAHEVTTGQFAAFVNETGYKTEAEEGGGSIVWGASGWEKSAASTWRNPGIPHGIDHPVVCVSWNDAVAFCEWLSKKEGRSYRLPTEAEWEYAARAGTRNVFPWGDDPSDGAEYANVADDDAVAQLPQLATFNFSDGYIYAAPVGSFKPNAWGLHDMIGNVWEWCADWLGEYSPGVIEPSGLPVVTDPQGPDTGEMRIVRGGSWYDEPRFCRAADRGRIAPNERYYFIGFRIVLDLY